MRVRHPRALEGDPPQIAVDVNGSHVDLDADGTFEIPDDARSWLDSYAAAHGVDAADLIVDESDAPAVDEWQNWNESDWLELGYQQRAEDVQEGRVDDHLDAIEDAETSETVKDAVDDRRSQIEAE